MSVFFRLLFQGIRDLFRMPWSLCMTMAAIVLVCFLGGAFLLLVHNLNLQIGERHGNVQFQVFWNSEATPAELKEVWLPNFAKTRLCHLPASSSKASFFFRCIMPNILRCSSNISSDICCAISSSVQIGRAHV